MYRRDGFIYPSPGTDIPRKFIDDLLSIDQDFVIFFHPYKYVYEDIINEYEGTKDDPRFKIGWYNGDRAFGWVCKNPDGSPQPDNTFHIWRRCKTASNRSLAHIVQLQSHSDEYLKLVTDRLYAQATFRYQYGDFAWNKQVRSDQEAAVKKRQQDKHNEWADIQSENKKFLNKARENMASGRWKPTNPTKEHITSYSGQKSRTKIVRPLEDREGGLVTGDD
jgi:hypothetical protein